MKVLAADGYILCRGVVRSLMLLHGDVSVTAADSIEEVLARIADLPNLDLILLDTLMSGMENFAGLQRIVELVPDVPVIVTSPSEGRAEILRAISIGARGYFSLSTKPCVLQHALPLIMLGEIYFPVSVFRRGRALVLPDVLAARISPAALTPRQSEIMGLLAEGKSNKEIARQLKVLEGTVKLHVKAVLRKLGVKNRTEAVLAAARAGYLSNGTFEEAEETAQLATLNAAQMTSRTGVSSPPSQPRAKTRRPAPKRLRGQGRNADEAADVSE
jgi:two-component system, NarL family, nitrate/nitrite response regulator NarL